MDKATDFERRASRRASRRISVHAGTDGADDLDDIDLQALGISDGFRPTSVSDVTASDDETAPTLSSASSSSSSSAPREETAPVPRTVTTTRPSSIAKPPAAMDSFALQNDGSVGPINQAFLSRQSSAATSTRSIDANADAVHGPSGSHAVEDGGARPAPRTVATSSSPPQESSYDGPRGPAFPYGLYPQNTVGIPAPTMAAIPVGFPGMSDNYRRQIGPDGEAPDMVGPDGHTEQLPPYTRYPEEAYARKAMPGEQPVETASASTAAPPADAATTVVAGASTTAAPAAAGAASAIALPAIPGAGGIGLAPRNPEFDGPEPDSPQSRHTSRSFTTGSDVSRHEINTAARAVTEKPKRTAGWQTYGRRRLWGIVPYWAICLLVTGLLLMGIILGAVVGSFVAKQQRRPPRPQGEP